MPYQPPFTLTTEILNLVAEVSQAVGRFTAEHGQEKLLRLRKMNRMRTMQEALAIEESGPLSTESAGISAGISAGLNAGLKLSQLDQAILGRMRTDPTITNAALAELTGKAISTIERRIKKLKENKLLKRAGAKKTGHWEVLL